MKAEYKSKLNLDDRVELQNVIPLDTPYLLYVDPSSICNFKCQFCPTGHEDMVKRASYKRQILDVTLFEKLIDGLDKFNNPIKVLRMNKVGEPLLNKNIGYMVRYAKQSGRVKYIDFATNAVLLNRQISETLVDSGLDRLNISIEGVNDEQYRKYCGAQVDFENMVSQIKYFYEIKGKCELVIKIPSNYISQEDQERFIEIFGDVCDRIFVENLTSIWPNFDINQEATNISVKEESQYGLAVKERKICTYIFYAMAVNADGTVSACCPDWEQKLIIGDLNKEDIYSIWNSDKLKQLQKQHLLGERGKNSVCGNCGHIQFCQVDDVDPYADEILKKWREKNELHE